MEDKWKKFVDENRQEFNSESPKDTFFERIAPKIPGKKEPRMVRLSTVMQMAAAVIVLVGTVLFFLLYKNTDEPKQQIANEKQKTDQRMVLAKMDPELAEAEYYYVTQIDQLMEEVEKKELTPDIKELIKQLDTEFTLLKNEMGEQVNSDQIVQALIENYRLKIKLLEKILNSYTDSNTENNEQKNNS